MSAIHNQNSDTSCDTKLSSQFKSSQNLQAYLEAAYGCSIEKKCIWRDYYLGGGRQWKDWSNGWGYDWDTGVNQKGIVTRSGKRLYDICPKDICGTAKGDRIEIYEWGEQNVINIAVKEKSLSCRGFGKTQFVFPTLNETANDAFNSFYSVNGGDVKLQKIIQNASIYGEQAVLVENGKMILVDPFEVYHSETRKATYRRFKAEDERGEFIFVAEYTDEVVNFYRDYVLQETIEHGLGFSPIVIFNNIDGMSDIEADIPEQDMINSILTRILSTVKRHLSPAVSISDDDTLAQAKFAAQNKEPFFFNRGPGEVSIMGKDGKINYQQWSGVPAGTMELYENIQKLYFKKKGLVFLDDNVGAVSGEAKKEARRVLNNTCQYMRDELTMGFTQLVQLFFAQQGFREPVAVDVIYAPMLEASETERLELESMKQEIALKDFAVFNNQEYYAKERGISEDEIADIVTGDLIIE